MNFPREQTEKGGCDNKCGVCTRFNDCRAEASELQRIAKRITLLHMEMARKAFLAELLEDNVAGMRVAKTLMAWMQEDYNGMVETLVKKGLIVDQTPADN